MVSAGGGVLIHRVRWCPIRIRGACHGDRLAAARTAVLCLRLGHDAAAVLRLTGLRDRVLATRTGRRRTGGVLIYRATASVLITTTAAILRGLIAGRLAVLACISLSSRSVIARLTVSAVEIALTAGLRILIRALAHNAARTAVASGSAGGSGARVLIARRRGAVLTRLIGNVDGLGLLIRVVRLG